MSLSQKTLSLAVMMALAGSAHAALKTTETMGADPVGHALGLIKAHPGSIKASAADGFTAADVVTDRDGSTHVRFNRSFRGLQVFGGDVVVHTDAEGAFRGASLTQRAALRVDTRPTLSADDALVAAGTRFGSDFTGMPKAELMVYARDGAPRLAYRVTMQGVDADGFDRDMTYFVDAKSGASLLAYSNIETGKGGKGGKPGGGGGGSTCSGTTSASGTGKSLFSGNVAISTQNCGNGTYQMKDLTRGGGYTTDLSGRTSGNGTIFSDSDNIWGNNSTSDRATVGADAHYGVATTWDYYKNVHGRNGIANDGKGALSRVHYGRSYVNAFWSDSCFCMTFGDGDGRTYYPLVDLDVAGHEMSHGVTSRSANLTYSGESGGLNEATSDIFGTMVEFYANNASDTPDYMIGEEIYINNPSGTKALRYMFKPSIDGASPDCYVSNLGSLDVHYSSGVANHFFYLLAEGATVPQGFSQYAKSDLVCNGNTSLNGIGRAKAEKIWYRALTVYMTSSTNYAGARTATLNAASDLYGNGSAEYNAVAAAWSAVSVN